MMRRLLKYTNYAAQLMALIDLGKAILQDRLIQRHYNIKKRNRLISQRLRIL